jgi:hypothetical protein
MKTLKLLVLGLILTTKVCAQYGPERSSIAIDVNYGSKAYNRPLPVNGSYEGLTIAYRTNFTYFSEGWLQPKYWEIQVWNSDLTHLKFHNDTASLNSFGAEYGLGTGVAFNLLSINKLNINLTPQIGFVYDTKGTIDATYTNIVFRNHFNPIARGMILINYSHAYLVAGISHQFNSLSNTNNYLNKAWIGIGVTQRWK